MHLLLTTVEDAFDVKAWSGIPYSLREALERQVERLTVFSPSRPARTLVDGLKRQWYGGTPKRYPLWMTRATLEQNAREVKAEIARVRPDAVLSISSQCVAYLEDPGVPVFLFSDAPWLAWHETYAGTISAPVEMERYAADEARAAGRLDGLCFGSEWAVGEAKRLYGVDGSRLHVTPLGANWVPGVSREEVLARVEARAADGLELLYVGKDWERKGGPLAVEVARRLGARLHIVGCRPELGGEALEFCTVHGLIYQSDPEGSARLAELFLRSHFLLVPTTAECFGIVFAEAQAFGLPPVSRAVHALPTVVEDGVTGVLLGLEAGAEAYVERILELRRDEGRYRAMAVAARERFETVLNWDRTATAILSAIRC